MKGLMMLFLAVTSVAALAAPQPKEGLTQGAFICAASPCDSDAYCKSNGCYMCRNGRCT
ncbi:hypothetical protein TMEN_1775 [Trichophyton mentagrophytes]|uniref:Uncharacterized protein n=2 Tax=Trichophyton TaxID=5550 RepID=A0A059IXP0_TRIIM|nr:hypothetical protein TEQG_08594 [Trichophyton equinum CBS 127.97]KDB20178.1 hypothetical protein H109_07874 [Trichophyton interdigitale MR816]GBF59733.1 hypothetical protein TMEN_1775 [Trichophyton mentagrophytes]